MGNINIAIVGVGNCASSLVQGINYYQDKDKDAVGLMHWEIGDYKPSDINVVAAFDIDKRKVGLDVAEAILSEPNNTAVFCKDIKPSGAKVLMGRILDGFSEHMQGYPDRHTFVPANVAELGENEVVAALKDSGAEVLLNYLPVGAEDATRFYAKCAVKANVAFINCIPVFIASDPTWANYHHTQNPHGPFQKARGQARTHLPAQHRRKHRLSQYAEPKPSCFKEDVQDRGRSVGGRAQARRRQHTHRPERLCPMAEGQQDMLHTHGRKTLRQRSHGY
jgi:hypothetical protein